MCQGCTMNFKTYRAYIEMKRAQEENTLTIKAENLAEVKKLLEENCYDVKDVDKIRFVNSKLETIAVFNVRKYTNFGNVKD